MAPIGRLPDKFGRFGLRRIRRCSGATIRPESEVLEQTQDTERQIDRGEDSKSECLIRSRTFSALIDLHVNDMKQVGKAPRRSKDATLCMLRRELGSEDVYHLDRRQIVRFARGRAKQGAGPVTLGIDIGAIKLVLTHAAAVHGIAVSVEQVDLARIALKHLGLICKSKERDRRPTPNELARLIAHLDDNPRQIIPVGRIIKFAVATAMRLGEICSVTRSDHNGPAKMLTIRDRKHPRMKTGNDQRIPLLAVSGYDAQTLIEEQYALNDNESERIFPFSERSVSAAFTRACKSLRIEDLHFHDLRHEGASRLFEAGFRIEQVALVTGHKDWKILRRYTHLRPESLHAFAPSGRVNALL